MTNYKTTLDEIILDIRKAESGQRDAHNTNNPQGVREHHLAQFDRCKQAILRWVADEVVGEDEEIVHYKTMQANNDNQIIRNSQRQKQRNILARHGYIGGGE